jgi:uncharacterized protein
VTSLRRSACRPGAEGIAEPVGRGDGPEKSSGVTIDTLFRGVRACVVPAALLLTAQSPAPAAQPWCATVPLAAGTCRPLPVSSTHATLRLAVAATEAQREHGLMNVPSVPAGEGMLFVFPDGDQPRQFWMKNTITPLDMVFVSGNGVITSVAAHVPATAPGTSDANVARRSGIGTYVIELGSGNAARLGLASGVRLAIPPVEAQ